MELIKKQISIDECRSHKAGLLPFIHSISGEIVYETTEDNNNYGHFVCDLSGSTGVLKYLDIIHRYNEVKNILRNAIYCHSIKNKNGKVVLRECNLDKINNIYCGEDCLEKTKPYWFIPENISDFIMLDNKTYSTSDDKKIKDGEFYVLLENFDTFKKHEDFGVYKKLSYNALGPYFTFIQYVEENMIKSNNIGEKYVLIPPCIEVPILLENECIFDTIYYPYEYSISGNSTDSFDLYDYNGECVVGEEIIHLNFQKKEEPDYDEKIKTGINLLSGITVESKLGLLTHQLATELASGYVGIINGWKYEDVDGPKLFKCIYYEGEYDELPILKNNNVYQVIFKNITKINEHTSKYCWFECIPIDETQNFKCCDGEAITEFTEDNKVFKNITLLSSIKYMDLKLNDGAVCYFSVRYQNGKIYPSNGKAIDDYKEVITLGLPFKVGERVNIETFDDGTVVYDEVLSAKEYSDNDNNYLAIEYVLKATSGVPDTGIFYTENLLYEKSAYTESVWVDGVSEADIFYEKLDYYTNSKEIYNEEYGLSSIVKFAKIIKFETHNFNRFEYPLITMDGSEKLFFEPKIYADMVFNRGNAAGWEKHFKLMECNTMQDLEKYGNNVFNL